MVNNKQLTEEQCVTINICVPREANILETVTHKMMYGVLFIAPQKFKNKRRSGSDERGGDDENA